MGRDSPILSSSKAGKEPILQGLKLHKIPVPGTSELSNIHQHSNIDDPSNSDLNNVMGIAQPSMQRSTSEASPGRKKRSKERAS